MAGLAVAAAIAAAPGEGRAEVHSDTGWVQLDWTGLTLSDATIFDASQTIAL
jgi:hypothetical protein